jgi:hypothetical protein
MNPIEPISVFNLLNVEGKRLVISNTRNLLEIVISIMYFGNPSQMYVKGLLDIASELLECMFLNDTNLFPQIKRDSVFLNILDRFNKLQKNEELQLINTLNRINCIEALTCVTPSTTTTTTTTASTSTIPPRV